MNTISRLHRKPGRFLGRTLSAGLSVWMLGVAFSPALASVPVDQAPLIIQKPLPPNIVLMLDDSGSMDSDYMPDNLSDSSSDGSRNASINGTYYNPKVTYVPPPTADSTSANPKTYPNSPSLTGAYKDGFLDSTLVDITGYKDSSNGNYPYYTNLSLATNITSSSSCNSGYVLTNSGSNYQCVWNGTGTKSNQKPTCSSGSLSNDNSQCVISSKNFFTYVTGPTGSYTRHYVGSTGDCAHLSTANQAVCEDSAAVQQSVANWFSYYRKRILMAKSGVMSAFSAVDPNFRVGFGSIDGSNASKSSLGDDYYAFSTSTSRGTYSTGLAVVKPFGDGTSGTQKSKMWNWLAGTSPSGYTPLRGALDAVGKYYGTQQPWLTLAGESGYVSGTNVELACRQSYSILTTDGFWNGSTPSGVGNVDNTKATLSGANNQSYTYTPASPYSDSVSNTLADVAMKYWVSDLRTSTPNEVPTSTEDPAFW